MSAAIFTVTWKQLDGKSWKNRSTWTVAENAKQAINNIKINDLGDKYIKAYKVSNFTARLSTDAEIKKAKSGKYYVMDWS